MNEERPTISSAGELLRMSCAAIAADWSRALRNRGMVLDGGRPVLADEVPIFLAQLSDALDAGRSRPNDHPNDQRDLGRALSEWSLLREILTSRWAERTTAAELRLIHRSIDQAMVATAADVGRRSELVSAAVERVATLSSDASLDDLLTAMRDAADSLAILVAQGRYLRVRSAIGLRDDEHAPVPISAEQGLIGTVAIKQRPMLLRDAIGDPWTEREAIRSRALYAAPMIRESRLLGVAVLGSANGPLGRHDEVLLQAIADRAATSIEHARLVARERAAHAVTRALGGASTLEGAASGLLEALGENFGWNVGNYFVLDERLSRLVHSRSWRSGAAQYPRFEAMSRDLVFHRGEGLPGRAWASGRFEWISDVGHDANFPRRPAAVEEGIRGAIAFPLRVGTRTLGVLELFSHEERWPSEEGVQMAQVIASQLGEFVARVAAEDAVRRSETEKSSLIDAALDCIVSMDATGRVTTWNPAAERTFGHTREEAVGQELATLIIPERLRDAHRRGLWRYLETGQGPVIDRRLEFPGLHRDGTEFPLELTVTRLAGASPPVFFGFIRDITDRKRRDDVLAIVSHDLKNPLGMIKASAALLHKHGDDQTARLTETMLRSADRMQRMIDDLLDMASIREGRLSMKFGRTQIESLIEEALRLHETIAQEKKITVRRELALAESVWCDRERVLQVLSNLLGNALKFCGDSDTITVRGTIHDGRAEISIADTGPGIPREELPRLFDPYWSAARHVSKGTGLGLYISRGIIEAHGGTIAVASEPGAGSTFTFTLPLE
jgi:PAS domain S-box-containing protein